MAVKPKALTKADRAKLDLLNLFQPFNHYQKQWIIFSKITGKGIVDNKNQIILGESERDLFEKVLANLPKV